MPLKARGPVIMNHRVDAVPPIHIVSNHEATAKVTTKYGGIAETSVNASV